MLHFLDVRASSTSPHAVPTDLAWIRENGAEQDDECYLVKPSPAWAGPTLWSPDLTDDTGCTYGHLVLHGTDARAIAARLVDLLSAPAVVLVSDDLARHEALLERLFTAAGRLDAPLLHDAATVLLATAGGDAEVVALARATTTREVQDSGRARSGAWRLRRTWEEVLGRAARQRADSVAYEVG